MMENGGSLSVLSCQPRAFGSQLLALSFFYDLIGFGHVPVFVFLRVGVFVTVIELVHGDIGDPTKPEDDLFECGVRSVSKNSPP